MREYKFRAFHKGRKEMYKVFSFCEDFIKRETVLGDIEKLPRSEFEPIQQYTGLTDKNGKEIYEGDVIEAWGQQTVVEYLEGSFMAKVLQTGYEKSQYDLLFNILSACRVIGNIYEHPNLLEATK